MPEFNRIRYVTGHYAHLQGLRIVPLGVLFVTAAVWRLGWFVLPGGADRTRVWMTLGFAAAIAVSFVIRADYERQFGRVRPRWGHTGVLPLIAMFLAFMALTWLQEIFRWPIPVPVVFVALCLTVTGLSNGGVRKHYLAVAVAVLGLTTLHSFGVSPDRQQVILDAVMGAGLIIAGVGDDLVLRRLLARPSSEAYASTR